MLDSCSRRCRKSRKTESAFLLCHEFDQATQQTRELAKNNLENFRLPFMELQQKNYEKVEDDKKYSERKIIKVKLY